MSKKLFAILMIATLIGSAIVGGCGNKEGEEASPSTPATDAPKDGAMGEAPKEGDAAPADGAMSEAPKEGEASTEAPKDGAMGEAPKDGAATPAAEGTATPKPAEAPKGDGGH